MKKIFVLIMTVLLSAALLVSGCTKGVPAPEGNETPSIETAAKPFEGITIHFLSNGGHLHGLDEVIPEFEEETGMKIEITTLDMTGIYFLPRAVYLGYPPLLPGSLLRPVRA